MTLPRAILICYNYLLNGALGESLEVATSLSVNWVTVELW
jgi:hypothetical protein